MIEKSFFSLEAWLREARQYAAQRVPYYAWAFYKAPFVLVEKLPGPAAIDREGRVYFNREWLEGFLKSHEGQPEAKKHILSMLGFVWYHEIAHWMRRHFLRAFRLKAEPDLWKLAADLEINDDLPAGLAYLEENGRRGTPLPQDFGLPPGKVAEWYYNQLKSLCPSQPSSCQQNRHKTSYPSQKSASSEVSEKAKNLNRMTGQRIRKYGWNEGSGVHGKSCPWELPAGEEGISGISGEENRIRARVRRGLQRPGLLQGKRPRGEKVGQSPRLQSRIQWKNLLNRTIHNILEKERAWRVDYSYARPHRRSALFHPFILPSLTGQPKPRIACVIDTSGSISDLLLGQTLRELQSLSEALAVSITVIPCDRIAYPPFTLSPWMPLKASLPYLRGGGGTDMREGLRAALSLSPRPDLIILFTDGQTPYPQVVPPAPTVLWVIWKPTGAARAPRLPIPPWQPDQVMVVPVDGL